MFVVCISFSGWPLVGMGGNNHGENCFASKSRKEMIGGMTVGTSTFLCNSYVLSTLNTIPKKEAQNFCTLPWPQLGQ